MRFLIGKLKNNIKTYEDESNTEIARKDLHFLEQKKHYTKERATCSLKSLKSVQNGDLRLKRKKGTIGNLFFHYSFEYTMYIVIGSKHSSNQNQRICNFYKLEK